jgi:hypothetical protein
MEVLLNATAVVIESALGHLVSVAICGAFPEFVYLRAGEAVISRQGVDNPYILVNQFFHRGEKFFFEIFLKNFSRAANLFSSCHVIMT